VLPVNGVPTVFPKKNGEEDPSNLLKVFWDSGPVKDLVWDDFDTIKERAAKSWTSLPKDYDPISAELNVVIKEWIEDYKANYQSRLAML